MRSLLAGMIFLLSAMPLASEDDCASLGDRLDRGDCHARRQRWKEAEEEFRLFLRANPDSAPAAAKHAEAQARLGHLFDAILSLERLLAREPDYAPALKTYAFLVENVEKNTPRAEDALERLVRVAPADADAWRRLGAHYSDRMKNMDAIRCYRRAVELEPSHALSHAGLALSYGRAGQEAEADKSFSRAIELNAKAKPPDPLVDSLHGDYLSERRMYRPAVEAYTRALAADPNSSAIYFRRGSCFEKLGDYRRAEQDALAAIRTGGDQKAFYMILMRVYKESGDAEKAGKAAEAVEELGEKEEAERSRGRLLREALREAEALMEQGRFADAIPHYERIAATVPGFHEAWFALGVCYSQTGRRRQAEDAFRKFLSLQPLAADGHAALGVLLMELGKEAEAQGALEEAVRLDPTAVEARKALAMVHLRRTNATAAVEVLHPVAGAPDADTDSLLLLAEAFLRAGSKGEALRQVERVLKAQPGHSQAARLKREIER